MRCMPIAFEIADRRAEPDHAGDVRRAGLELPWQLVVRRLLERDREDHVAAALPRRHRFEQRSPPVQHADAGRPDHLVRREAIEIAIELAHVHDAVRHGLRAIEQYRHAVALRDRR